MSENNENQANRNQAVKNQILEVGKQDGGAHDMFDGHTPGLENQQLQPDSRRQRDQAGKNRRNHPYSKKVRAVDPDSKNSQHYNRAHTFEEIGNENEGQRHHDILPFPLAP